MSLVRRPGAAVATLIILLVGAAFLTQVFPYGQIVESRRQVREAREHLAELQAQNTALQADVAALESPSEIERLAREKLGYVMPGEIAYVVLDPPGTVEEPSDTETVVEQPAEDLTWVDRVWAFLTGADLGS